MEHDAKDRPVILGTRQAVPQPTPDGFHRIALGVPQMMLSIQRLGEREFDRRVEEILFVLEVVIDRRGIEPARLLDIA